MLAKKSIFFKKRKKETTNYQKHPGEKKKKEGKTNYNKLERACTKKKKKGPKHSAMFSHILQFQARLLSLFKVGLQTSSSTVWVETSPPSPIKSQHI